MITDPIADMLTRIRNANMVYKNRVDIPASKLKKSIVKILKDEGFIKGFRYVEDGRQGILRVYLKYGPKKERVINELIRVSKPGRRIYVGKDEIPEVKSGLGVAILSTSKGVMTDKECRRLGIGGELLCIVW